MKFGISGIWEHPQSTIPALVLSLGGIAVALGWTDTETVSRLGGIIGSVLIAVIGGLYKGNG